MKTRLGRLLGMTLILATTSASPVFAAGELGLSLDGTHWLSSISTPLFDPSFRWVPGDSDTATFFVRNQGGSTGDLTVDILGSKAGDLINSGDLHVTAKGGGGAWKTVSEGGTHRLLTAPHIPNGHVNEISVTVSFDAYSSNLTQLRSSELNFRITLTESAATANGGSALPDTGAADLRWYAASAAFFIATGLALVSRRATSAREADHV